ncbi:MAG: PHP domain-containing protein [Chloroflexi bacterium]|nr:PHP domain-containing protein [Chloroflexota bacterium]
MLRADLHLHTCYSRDCRMMPEEIVARCQRVGINCLAVTDHNTIEGALEVQKIASFPVIVGEEIKTTQGEIIGLFLTQEIPRGLTPLQTVTRIKEQGGLVVVPHPLDRLRRSRLRYSALMDILPQVDALEVLNSRVTFGSDCRRARALARDKGLLTTVGSDAHTLGEIGAAWVEMPQFHDLPGFRDALAQGRVSGRLSSPLVHFFSLWNRWRRSRGRLSAIPRRF